MWYYKQSTGDLLHDSTKVAVGYAGQGAGLNNPDMENVRDYGPVPKGLYDIGKAFKHPSKGPVCMRLVPSGHNSLGRDGFMIHGDNSLANNTASQGCIILWRPIREQIANSGDNQLTVIE